MAMLSNRSRRFTRSFNYNLPEYRQAAPRGQKTGISVVVPATHERTPDQRNNPSEHKR